jgi:hypothetical protein
MEIISRKDAKSKDLKHYFTGTPCKNGHVSERFTCDFNCVECRRDRGKSEDRKLYIKNYYSKNSSLIKGRSIEYYKNNTAKCNASSTEYNRNNPEKKAVTNQKYSRNHKGSVNAKTAKRHAGKINRTPSYANLSAIRLFYKNCPLGYVVDHVIPLQGKLVSGFHIETNLQYLTNSENCSKGNKFNANN